MDAKKPNTTQIRAQNGPKRYETAGAKKAETLPTEPSKDKKRPQ